MQVTACKASDNWTNITFSPDLAKFGMTHLEAHTVALMRKRVYDLAGVLGKTVKVWSGPGPGGSCMQCPHSSSNWPCHEVVPSSARGMLRTWRVLVCLEGIAGVLPRLESEADQPPGLRHAVCGQAGLLQLAARASTQEPQCLTQLDSSTAAQLLSLLHRYS